MQATLIGDGSVTSDEYNLALGAGKTCMEDAGYRVSDIQHLPDGLRRDFIVYGPAPGASSVPEDPTEAWAVCRRDNYAGAEAIWLAQQQTSAEAAIGALETCLEKNGITGYNRDMLDHEVVTLLDGQNASIDGWFCRERYLIEAGAVVVAPPD